MSTAIAALPFFGGTLACFDPSDSTVIESTQIGSYNTTFSTCSLFIAGDSGQSATSPTWTAAATSWTHIVQYIPSIRETNTEDPIVQFLNATTVVAQLTVFFPAGIGNAATYRLYTLQSGVMTLVGSANLSWPALQTIDVKLVGNTASGSAALYSAGTLAIPSGSLNHSGWPGVTQIRLMPPSVQPIYFSQIKVDTASTIGSFIRTDRLNTNGASQQWTGGVGNINEIPTNDSTFISVTTSNQISTFYESGLSLAGYAITGRGVGARMRVQSTNPPAIKLVIRSGATNFASAHVVAAVGFQAAFNSWTTDPHTSVAWTATNAAVAQTGVESSA